MPSVLVPMGTDAHSKHLRAAVVALVALVGGCGGPSGSIAPTSTPEPTAAPAITWELVHEATSDGEAVIASDVVYGDAGFLALTIRLREFEGGPRQTGQALLQSVDGRTWIEVPLPVEGGESGGSDVRLATTRGGDYLVFSTHHVGELGSGLSETRTYRSSDGTTWAEVQTRLPTAMTVLGVHHGPSASVLVGYSQGDQPITGIWQSDDGVAWELAVELEMPGRFVEITGAGAGPEEFVVIGTLTDADLGAYEYFTLTSSDAVDWARATPDLVQEEGYVLSPALSAFGDGWVAALHTPPIDGIEMVDLWTSPDGESWSRAGRIERDEQLSSFQPRFVEAAGRLYFSTDGGRHAQHSSGIWSSGDATGRWEPVDLGVDAALGGVVEGAGVVVMAATTLPDEGFATAGFWVGSFD